MLSNLAFVEYVKHPFLGCRLVETAPANFNKPLLLGIMPLENDNCKTHSSENSACDLYKMDICWKNNCEIMLAI